MESESIADPSEPSTTLSSTGVIDEPRERLSRNMHPDSDEKSPFVQISLGECLCINKIKSPEDEKPFLEKSFGCGICGEMLETRMEFLEHCSSHRFSPPDDVFIDLR